MGSLSNLSHFENNSFKLSSIIQEITKKSIPFADLFEDEKFEVLEYIKSNNLDIKIFYRKGFDFFKQKFFAIEYFLDNQNIATSKVRFDDFCNFYEYVKHEIYGKDSCFYGYDFTTNEISKYKIKREEINYSGFISYKISDNEIANAFTNKLKTIKSKSIENKALKERLDATLKKPTETAFFSIFSDFKSLNYPIEVCLSMISRSKNKKSKDSFFILPKILPYNYLKYFTYIWFHYGDNDAIRYINELENMGINQIYLSSSKKELKHLFKNFNDAKNNCKFLFTYDDSLALYVLKISFYYFNILIETIDEYFFSADEMLNFYNVVLPKCNISKAPKKLMEIPLYLPINVVLPTTSIKRKEIKKYYRDNLFRVDITLYDSHDGEAFKSTFDFDYFFDFIYFLNNDLSNCDLSNCYGSEKLTKIPQLNLENALLFDKMSNSSSLIHNLSNTSNNPNYVQLIEPNEIETSNDTKNFLLAEPNLDFIIAYITDIHLSHRLSYENINSYEDTIKCVAKVSKSLKEDYVETIKDSKLDNVDKFLFIGGDITDKPHLYNAFIEQLGNDFGNNYRGTRSINIFITLGNHELWAFSGQSFESITDLYKNYLDSYNIYLVQNNLFYLNSDGIHEINSEDLINISDEDLIGQTRTAYLIVFGGIGFAGNNSTYNADLGLYKGTINREQEIEETNKFYSLYLKVKRCLRGQNVVVFTHMPIEDWANSNEDLAGFIYINGHTHKNFFDNDKKICSNSQIGYKNKKISLKYINLPKTYSWFRNYNDGISEISRLDYMLFYEGLNISIELNYDFDKLYMVKRNNFYIFFLENKNKLYILKGGAKIKIEIQDLNYYYEHMLDYGNTISNFMRNFNNLLTLVSNEVKKIGGNGTIHGSIVDIDYYNHIYINPIDKKFTFYFATDIINKYVYKNYVSLLKYKLPELYDNYIKLISQNSSDKALILYNSLEISCKRIYVPETDMYKISKFIKNQQYFTNYNVIRGWDDSIFKKSQKNKEKLVLQNVSDNLITLKDS